MTQTSTQGDADPHSQLRAITVLGQPWPRVDANGFDLRRPGEPQGWVAEVEHESLPGWRFRLIFDQETRSQVQSFAVERVTDDAPALGARSLRDVRYGEIEAAARSKISESFLRLGAQLSDSLQASPGIAYVLEPWLASATDLAREWSRPAAAGQRGHDDSYYVDRVVRYLHLANEVRDPIAVAAREMNYSMSGMRNLLHTARARGLLTSPPRGRAGGRLTDKALRILAERENSDGID